MSNQIEDNSVTSLKFKLRAYMMDTFELDMMDASDSVDRFIRQYGVDQIKKDLNRKAGLK